MIGIELVMACAPNVAPETTQQIIQVESGSNPLAINVNKGRLERQPRDAADAAGLAKKYIAQGYTVDLGLMQVNSTNVARLGYRIEEMFEPCKNIAAGARVLTAFYANARPKYDSDQSALRAALSAYNTGSFINGFTNGYLARYGIGGPIALARVPALNPYTAETAVFIRRMKEQAMSRNNAEAPQSIAQQDAPAQREQVTPVVSQSTEDADAPGVQVEYTPDQADRHGAFEETALSERDAWDSNADLTRANDPDGTAIVVNGKSMWDRAVDGEFQANGKAQQSVEAVRQSQRPNGD